MWARVRREEQASLQSQQGPEEGRHGEKAYTLELRLVSSHGTASVNGRETIHLQTSLYGPWDNVLCIVFPKEKKPVSQNLSSAAGAFLSVPFCPYSELLLSCFPSGPQYQPHPWAQGGDSLVYPDLHFYLLPGRNVKGLINKLRDQ